MPPFNASSRKDIRAAEKEAKLAETNNREVVTDLMSTTIGRAWVLAKLESCHMFNDPFSGDALLEAYRKGERNVGLVLLADLMLFCPDQYVLMMREANDRSTAAEYRRGQGADGRTDGPESDPAERSEFVNEYGDRTAIDENGRLYDPDAYHH